MKYQNILLVYPEVPGNTYWSFKHALKFIRKKCAMPPLGLITVAALFPEHYHLKLVDMNIEPLRDKDIQWADAVFISAMIVQQDSMKNVIAQCKRFHKTIVAGGPYVNSNYHEIQDVDHLVLGEVEETFQDFLHDLQNGTAKSIYDRPAHPDISHTPAPRFDLLNIQAYGSMAIQYSRGCPFHCEFCDIWTVYGNKPRLKSAASIIHELNMLYRLGWRGAIFIVDDNFIGNKSRVKKELLPALKDWQKAHGYPFHFYTEASINMADDEALLVAMREAGFNEVFIGIETPNPDGLKETGKIQNLTADLEKSVYTIQRHGIEVMAGFIVGFDNDTEDIFDRQISFIQKNAIPKAMIGLLTALPNTRLYQRLLAEGRILKATLGNNTHTLTTNFKTIMDGEKLKEGYKKILAYLYDSRLKHYFDRCNRLFDRMEYREFFQRKIQWKEITFLLKSLIRQPFTPYGFQYLKFVIRNLFKNPDLFGEVITFGIVGHHFHKITQETLKIDRIAAALDKKYQYFVNLINQYSAALLNNSLDNIAFVAKLWKKRVKLLKQMKEKIDAIPADFRHELTAKYLEISRQMRDLMNRFEQLALTA